MFLLETSCRIHLQSPKNGQPQILYHQLIILIFQLVHKIQDNKLVGSDLENLWLFKQCNIWTLLIFWCSTHTMLLDTYYIFTWHQLHLLMLDTYYIFLGTNYVTRNTLEFSFTRHQLIFCSPCTNFSWHPLLNLVKRCKQFLL